ncbi:MAG: hypothetical protein ACKVU4_12640 [Phycisphaerales bacterium]
MRLAALWFGVLAPAAVAGAQLVVLLDQIGDAVADFGCFQTRFVTGCP